MVDGQRADPLVHPGYRRERHQFSLAGTDIEHIEHRGIGAIAGLKFKDHIVLVVGAIDSGDGSVAEGAVEGFFNLTGRDAEEQGPVTVDIDIEFGIFQLQVAGDIEQAGLLLHGLFQHL